MSADSHRIRELLDDSLADLDDKLGTSDDRRLRAELRDRIAALLRDNHSAVREIRMLLKERYDDGDLRSETYRLVQSIVDDHVTEELTTEPTGQLPIRAGTVLREFGLATNQLGATVTAEDEYASTAVIHDEVLRPATADDHVQVGSVLRDRFLLQERLSGGSMGVVYKALDRRLAETGATEPWVAIKVLSPELSKNGTALRALQQEAAKGRYLSHAHIVRFIDLDREDDLYFIVMEWLEGRTLASILDSAEGKSMGTDQSVGIVRQLASALAYAHRCGIIHADVKPANVMILPNGDSKLFDFGVARVQQSQRGARDDFDPGVLGALTPAYSSMQVLTGEEPVPSDDVFSLGCLFYRLVAGHRVFGPRNATEAAEEGMTPQRPQGLSEVQWRTLKKAISFSRVTRFQSMGEFMDALDDRSISSIDIGPTDAFDIEETGGSRSWLAGLVALLLLLGFAVYQFGFSDPFGWNEPVRTWFDAQLAGLEDTEPKETPRAVPDEKDIVDLPAEGPAPIADYAASGAQPGTTAPDGGTGAETPAETQAGAGADAAPTAADNDIADEPPVTDLSNLVAADIDAPLTETTGEPAPVTVRLREDAGPTVVDLRRTGSAAVPLDLRLEEVGYTGNRSPWASAQYTISASELQIPAGQDRARLTLQMASDPLREADQVSTLRVRSTDSPTTQYATLEVELEDDDQRAFESRLPTNTIGFAVSQVAVRERDPVVQVDVLRFNPDDTQIVVGYSVGDITAKEGEDYFSPGGYSVSFGPGQRSARLLIPLVQDTNSEGDEAFTVELATGDTEPVPDVFRRIVIMIRDDEIAVR